MDYRTESLIRRFKSAQPHLLAADPQKIVSIKYRDDSVPGSIYERLADDIGPHGMAIDIRPLSGEFGGRAWLAKTPGEGRAILVEHETGLEILGAIGSVASLISLVPLVGAAWRRLRGHFHPMRDEMVEIRRMDESGNIVEERAPSIEVYVVNLTLQRHTELETRIAKLEREITRLKDPSAKSRKSKRRSKKK